MNAPLSNIASAAHAAAIPSRFDFDMLIGACTPGDWHDLVAVTEPNFNAATLTQFFGDVWDHRRRRADLSRSLVAGQWFDSQESYWKGLTALWGGRRNPAEVAPLPHAPRDVYIETMVASALARLVPPSDEDLALRRAQLVSLRPALYASRDEADWDSWHDSLRDPKRITDRARRSLRQVIDFDWMAYRRVVALAFRDYFWHDIQRELRKVDAIKKAREVLTELRQIIDGPYAEAYPPEVELESTGRYRSISDELAGIERRLLTEQRTKMPKMRNDGSLRERLLLWDLRNGLRQVRPRGKDRVAALYELMHLEGVQGTWDLTNIHRRLKMWAQEESMTSDR